jgi:hypothetical protein
MESRILADALRSVHDPIAKFIKTGIYSNPHHDPDMPKELMESSGAISSQQTQRVCRAVANELKRPFIIMSPIIHVMKWERVNGRWTSTRHEPKFSHVYIVIPKRKYLMPLVTPLLLACGDMGTSAPVRERHRYSLWNFHIHVEELWNEYRAGLDRPEMRAARRLPPITP